MLNATIASRTATNTGHYFWPTLSLYLAPISIPNVFGVEIGTGYEATWVPLAGSSHLRAYSYRVQLVHVSTQHTYKHWLTCTYKHWHTLMKHYTQQYQHVVLFPTAMVCTVRYLLCQPPVLLLLPGPAAVPLFCLPLQVEVVALTALTCWPSQGQLLEGG